MEWTKVTDGLPRKSRPVLVTLSEPNNRLSSNKGSFF